MRNFTFILMMLTASLGFSQETFPIDFETGDFSLNNFGGSQGAVVDNPVKGGENTSLKVLELKKGGEGWAGSSIIRTTNVDFTTNSVVTMKVYTNRVGAKIKFKLENNPDFGISLDREVETSVANAWETLTFDFSGETKPDLSTITLYIDDGTGGLDTEDWHYYVDDIAIAPSTKQFPSLPISFEDDIDYGIEDFNKNISEIVDNTFKSGINTSNKVVKVQKRKDWWAGSAMIIDDFIDFSASKFISIKVYSPRVGVPVKLKLEGKVDATELDVSTTVANEWEYLTFDFSEAATDSYNKLVIFFNPGVDGVDNEGDVTDDGLGWSDFTFYYDNIELLASPNLSDTFGELADKINMHTSNGTLSIDNLEELQNGKIEVFGITGRKLSSKIISNNNETLELGNNGIFVVLISDENGNKVTSRKVAGN